jgi:cysteine synthase A
MSHILFIEASITGAGQLANRFAREKGLFVSFMSRAPQAYGDTMLRDVDEVHTCETNDPQAVLAAVRALHERRPLRGITTTADFYVPIAALAARELGLAGMPPASASLARNKHAMRERLAERAPQLNPRFALITRDQDASASVRGWGWPVVAKPVDENDGTNVRLIRTEQELAQYMAVARGWALNSSGQQRSRDVLLEEFVDAPEYSVETLQCMGGDLQLMGVTVKEVIGLERGHFVEVGHHFPATEQAVVARLFAATRDALEALEIDCGTIHTECRLRGDEVKIMEINPRLAGGKIGSHLIEMATGENPCRAVVDIAMGERFRWSPPRSGGAALRKLWSDRDGIFQGLENPPGTSQDTAVEILLPPGTRVRPPENNGDTLVAFLAADETAERARARVVAATNRARLLIDPIR